MKDNIFYFIQKAEYATFIENQFDLVAVAQVITLARIPKILQRSNQNIKTRWNHGRFWK